MWLLQTLFSIIMNCQDSYLSLRKIILSQRTISVRNFSGGSQKMFRWQVHRDVGLALNFNSMKQFMFEQQRKIVFCSARSSINFLTSLLQMKTWSEYGRKFNFGINVCCYSLHLEYFLYWITVLFNMYTGLFHCCRTIMKCE